MAQRLPTPGGDDGQWGDILNSFLGVSHASDGTLNSNVVGTSQIQAGAVTNTQLDTNTQTAIASVSSKYTVPAGGIPASDLATAVQTDLSAASTALQTAQLGANGGVASLDSAGKLTSGQVPSSVADATGAAAGYVPSSNGSNGLTWAPRIPKQPLVIDGQLLREGTGGPRYRATGYNAHVGTDSYPTSASMTTIEQLDKYFSTVIRPNSLTRIRFFAPGTSLGITWDQQLAWYDKVVAAAQANDQRLILCVTTWGSGASGDQPYNAFGPTTAWVTGQQYLHSVSGANSYQDWVQTLATRYAGNYTVAMFDLCNEPQDSGGANTSAFASWVSAASGWIKAIDPNFLVYMGIDVPGSVGGTTQYQTISAGADLCSMHYYDNYGFVPNQGQITAADALGKPLIIDETGVWAKDYFDATDTAPSGTRSAITHEAAGQFWREQALRQFAEPEVCAVLYYSYMDSDNGQGNNSDTGKFEPLNESLLRKVIRTVDLHGEPFNKNTLASLTASPADWVDAPQTLLYQPGTPIGSYYSRASDGGGTVTGGPLAGQWNGHPSFLFTGTQKLGVYPWSTYSPQASYFFAFVPNAVPGSGSWAYLMSPSGPSPNGQMGLRINSAGNIELVLSCLSANEAPSNDTVKATSSNAVNLNGMNTLAVIWNSSATASNGWAAGAWNIVLNGSLTSGTVTGSPNHDANTQLGIAYDNVSDGYQGHIMQAFMEPIAETPALRAKALAYLSGKYTLIS